jgi:hypothetical protein
MIANTAEALSHHHSAARALEKPFVQVNTPLEKLVAQAKQLASTSNRKQAERLLNKYLEDNRHILFDGANLNNALVQFLLQMEDSKRVKALHSQVRSIAETRELGTYHSKGFGKATIALFREAVSALTGDDASSTMKSALPTIGEQKDNVEQPPFAETELNDLESERQSRLNWYRDRVLSEPLVVKIELLAWLKQDRFGHEEIYDLCAVANMFPPELVRGDDKTKVVPKDLATKDSNLRKTLEAWGHTHKEQIIRKVAAELGITL